MNESLDSISSFFNKLLNIKTKDQSLNNTRDQMNTLTTTNQSANKSFSSNKSSKDQIKTTSKLTIDSLKAGLSDILDETNDYLNSIRSINLNAGSSLNINDSDLIKRNNSKIKLSEHNLNKQVHFNEQNKMVLILDDEESFKKSSQIDSINKSEIKDEQNNLEKNNLQSNLENLMIKNEKILSIDSKSNEKSINQDYQIVNINKDEKLNLNKNDNNLNKVVLKNTTTESTNQLNNKSVQRLPENVCFLPFNHATDNKIFEEINLECVKDVKNFEDIKKNINENIRNDTKNINDEKYSKINENKDKLITKDSLTFKQVEGAEEKQEIDKRNDDLELVSIEIVF